MSLIRAQDWEDRLATYLDRVAEEPFQYGTHDCSLFAASCVKAMTGEDPAEPFRGKYDTAAGAARSLREDGAGTLLKTLRAMFEEVSIHFAQRGDVVMRNATTAGICVGQFSYFVGLEAGREGLLVIPTSECRYAFRVAFEATS